MYIIRAAAFFVISAAFVQVKGEKDLLIPWPGYVEETVQELNIGSCHKNILENLPSYRELRETCINEAVEASGLQALLHDDTAPSDSGAYSDYIYAFEHCKLVESGALRDDHVDFNAIIKFLDLPDAETMINFDRCIEIKRMESCERTDQNIGMKNIFKLDLLSVNAPKKCPDVLFPESDMAKMGICASKVLENTPMTDFDDEDQAAIDLFFLHFRMDILKSIHACFLNEVGFPNNLAGYVANLDGWQYIPQRRVEIVNALTTCEQHLHPDNYVKFKKRDDGYDGQRGKMAKFSDYTSCLTPKIDHICGTNSEVAKIIQPIAVPEIREAVYQIYEEITGHRPLHLVRVLKVGLFEP